MNPAHVKYTKSNTWTVTFALRIFSSNHFIDVKFKFLTARLIIIKKILPHECNKLHIAQSMNWWGRSIDRCAIRTIGKRPIYVIFIHKSMNRSMHDCRSNMLDFCIRFICSIYLSMQMDASIFFIHNSSCKIHS